MKHFTLLFLMLFASVGMTQAVDLPLDFESGTYTITDFDGGELTIIDNPQSSGINTSAKVGQMIKNDGQPWGGSLITLDNPIDFSVGKTFKMKVFSPRVDAKVLLKVENLDDSAIAFEKEVLTTVANEWEELTFDYGIIDDSKSYQKVVLIFDNGTAGDGSANYTFLIDDIKLVDESSENEAPTLPLDFEAANVDYTFSNFSGGEATVIDNPQSSGINTSAKVGQMIKNTGDPWGGSFIALKSPIDFSAGKTFKMKVFSPRVGAVVTLKVENISDGGIALEKVDTSTIANEWEELSFDFSTIDDTKSYQKIVLIFDNGTAGDGSANFTFLFDDIMQFNEGSETEAPTLPLDFEATNLDYTFTGFDGGEVTVIDNPQSSGINTSTKVGQMVKNAGQPWGGSWIALKEPIDFTMGKTIKMKVFSPRVGAKVTFKVENISNGGINLEKEVATTVANEWEELSFDFSIIDVEQSYQKVVLIFDNGTMGDGSADFTFLFDDIMLVDEGSETEAPTLPLDFESENVEYTFTGFDGGEVTVIDNPQSTGINTSATVGQMVKNAGQAWGGSWIALKEPIDFSAGKTFKMKIFSPRANAKVLLKVENLSDGGINFEQEDSTSVANEWEELSFDFSAIDDTKSYQKIVLIFDNGTMGDGSANFTFLFDDIELANATSAKLTELQNIRIFSRNSTLVVNGDDNILNGTVDVFDLTGRKIYQNTIQNTTEQIQLQTSGIVIVRVSDRDFTQVKTQKVLLK